jgi:hypothetical protein
MQNTRSGSGNDATLVTQVGDHIGGSARIYQGLYCNGTIFVSSILAKGRWELEMGAGDPGGRA